MSTTQALPAATQSTYDIARAIWHCGRLTNQIMHQMHVMWLTGRDSKGFGEWHDAFYVSSAIPWDELRLQVRELFSSESARDNATHHIDDSKWAWEGTYRSEYHCCDVLESTSINFSNSYKSGETPVAMGAFTRQICNEVLSCIGDTSSRIIIYLDTLISHWECSGHSCWGNLYRLAQMVDRTLHYLPAYAVLQTSDDMLYAYQNENTIMYDGGNPVLLEPMHIGNTSFVNPTHFTIHNFLPCYPVRLPIIGEHWTQEYNQRLRHLGMDGHNIESLSRAPDLHSRRFFVQEIEEHVLTCLQQCTGNMRPFHHIHPWAGTDGQAIDASEVITDTEETPPNQVEVFAATPSGGDSGQDQESQQSFGLVVDEDACEVTRRGHIQPICFEQGSAEWHTFLVCWRNQVGGVAKEQWEIGYPAETNEQSMRKVKSRVSKKLQVLGLNLTRRYPFRIDLHT
ncbi:MAG: hypothetical protein KDA76_05820 [Planctomycetaceae bacterium]|nr:hypothetical protein [Planctomycetaceae bacterium]